MLAWKTRVDEQLAGLGGGGDVGPALAHRRSTGDVERTAADVEHDVGDIGLEQAGGDAFGLLDQTDRRLVHGDAALLQRARAHRAGSDRRQVGVAPHEREVVDVDAGLGAGDRRPRRVVPLAVRRRAGEDRARAVVVDLDLGGLVHRRHAARDLDVDADADPEQLACRRARAGASARRAAAA